MKTANEVYAKALSFLGAYGAGQTPSAEDMAVADAAFRPLMDELASLQLCFIPYDPDENDVPCVQDEFFVTIAKILANEIAPECGQPSDEGGRQILERRLRLLTSTGSYGQVQQAEYF